MLIKLKIIFVFVCFSYFLIQAQDTVQQNEDTISMTVPTVDTVDTVDKTPAVIVRTDSTQVISGRDDNQVELKGRRRHPPQPQLDSSTQGIKPIIKLGVDESRKAGRAATASTYKSNTWYMAGFCSGLSFGLAGIGLMGVSAEVLSPRAPTAPLNVDVDAWSAGYRSKVKSKRLIKGIIGSVVGTALMVVVFSIAPTN